MIIVKISAKTRGPQSPFFWSFSYKTEETRVKFSETRKDKVTVRSFKREDFTQEIFKAGINEVFFGCDYIKLIAYI